MRISDWSSDVCSSDLDDGRKTHGFGALVLAQRRPQPVEIVALGRRTLAAADHQPQSPVARNQRRYREQRRGIVGIAADVKADILALPCRERPVQHRRKHFGLVPRGPEPREAPVDRRCAGNPRRVAAARHQPPAVEQQYDTTSSREEECQYVYISVVATSLKTNKD